MKPWVAYITPESKQQPSIGVTVELPTRRNQTDFVGAESDVHGVLGQMGHSPPRRPTRSEMVNWLLSVTAEIAMGHSEQAALDA